MRRDFSRLEILDALKKEGFRITRQRKAIVDYLAGKMDHPSPRQIYDAVRYHEPGISLATVYNTLMILHRLRLVQEIQFEHASNRYDTNISPHINLICTNCGRIRDLEYNFPIDPAEIRSKCGFETRDYRLEYHGICSHCR